jgi:two-component system sensor histidine kinase VicK
MPDNPLLNERQLLAILSASKDATAIYTTNDLRIQFVNDAMAAFWGKDRGITGMALEDAVPELRGQPFAKMLRNVLRTGLADTGSAIPAETFIDGKLQTRYYSYVYEPVKDEHDNTFAVLHTAADVTGKVLAEQAMQQAEYHQTALEREQLLNEELAAANEELNVGNEELTRMQASLLSLNEELERRVAARTSELSESEARFRAMAEGSGILIAVTDETRNAVYFNKAWLKFTGKTHADLQGFGWTDLLHPDDRERYLGIFSNAFKKRHTFNAEFRIRDRENRYSWLLANGVPRLLPDGSFLGYVSSCTDITALKEVEQRKDDFISIASHELKTPLTSLKASLQLMDRVKEQAAPPVLPRLIDQCNRSMVKITTLVEDLLNTSRSRESQLHLTKSRFDITEMLKNCCSHIRLGGSHELVMENDGPLHVFADEHKIDQVIVNLVNNAVKYAPKSREIFLKTEKLAGMAKVSIRDTGPGIAMEKQSHLFERYYRADESGQYSGLGLGLYISAEIVRRHNGGIGVESKPGRGSTFWFTLPLDET